MRENEEYPEELNVFGPESQMLPDELEAFEAELAALRPEDKSLDRAGLKVCLQMYRSGTGIPPSGAPPVLGFLGDCFKQGMSFFSKSSVFSLLVAIGIPGLVLSVAVLAITRQGAPEEHVARIIRTHDCLGYVDEIDAVLSANMKLVEGQQITLQKGFVEIFFERGSRVIVEAPAVFEVRSSNSGFIKVGRLVASVSPRAHGFTIQTPLATVVDLGTNFGVSVAEDMTAEAHVFKGMIKVTSRGTPQDPVSSTAFLTEGQAARIPAPVAGKTSKIILMAAVPERFVRQPLIPPSPKRKIVFAHHGSADPATEGWKPKVFINHKKTKELPVSETASVNEDGTAAWMIHIRSSNKEIHYRINRNSGLTPRVIKQAKAKGWVLRVRIKISSEGQKGPLANNGGHCLYCDGSRIFGVFPELQEDGNQVVILRGESSLGTDAAVPIPNSRDRFIDYEIRYDLATDSAEVFVDGQSVATGCYQEANGEFPSGIQFGLQKRRPSKGLFATVEWEIIQ